MCRLVLEFHQLPPREGRYSMDKSKRSFAGSTHRLPDSRSPYFHHQTVAGTILEMEESRSQNKLARRRRVW